MKRGCRAETLVLAVALAIGSAACTRATLNGQIDLPGNELKSIEVRVIPEKEIADYLVQSGLKPVIAVPGLTPTSPATAPAAVQVTVDAPRIPKLVAEPRVGADAANAGDGPKTKAATPMLANRIKYLHFLFEISSSPSYGKRSRL